jgi:hypothetical protein
MMLRGRVALTLKRPGSRERDARESPASAAGQEEADEEVVLRRRVDVVETEHGNLESTRGCPSWASSGIIAIVGLVRQ